MYQTDSIGEAAEESGQLPENLQLKSCCKKGVRGEIVDAEVELASETGEIDDRWLADVAEALVLGVYTVAEFCAEASDRGVANCALCSPGLALGFLLCFTFVGLDGSCACTAP